MGIEIRHYVTESGSDPYQEWLNKLKDQALTRWFDYQRRLP